MSNGTLLAGLGALAGSVLPGVGAGLGLQIGAALGSVLETSPAQERGKVSDLRFSGSSLDVPIPRVWGSVRIGGNVVWMARNPKTKGYFFERKRTKRVGGSSLSKGTAVSDFTYSASPLYLLAVGTLWFPEEDATLWREPDVTEIYFGTELVYRKDASGVVKLNKHGAVILRGTDTQNAPSLIVSNGGRGAQTPAFRGSIAVLFPDLNVTPFGNQLPQMSAVVKTAPVTVGDVLSDLARLAGIPAAWIDFSDADMPLTGFAWLERAAPRTAMETICRAYALDLIETDGKLIARRRYADKVPFVVPEGWLGAGQGSPAAGRVSRVATYERDLPARVSVGFYDSGSLYERSVAEDVRQTGDTSRDATFPTGLTLTAAQAREIAARESDEAWAGREAIEMPLPFGAIYLEPGDLISFTDDDEDLTAKIEIMTCDPLGIVRVAGKLFDVDAGTRASFGGATGNASVEDAVASPSVFTAFSGREIAPEHQASAGFYVAASGDDGWRGGTAWYLPPGATEWLRGPDLTSRAVFGVTSTALDSGTAGELDEGHSVRVDVSASFGALGSVEDEALTTGENLAWIGDEILAFAIADPVLSGSYDLSRLLRGVQGSEAAAHGSGERFVLAEEGGLGRVEVPETHVGLVYGVKVLSPGQSLADVAAQRVTIVARNRTATEEAISAMTRTVTIATTTISTQTGAFVWRTVALPSAPSGTRLAWLEAEVKDGGGSGLARVLARDADGGPETPLATADLDSGQAVNFSSGAWVRVGGADGAYSVDLRSVVGFDSRQTVNVLAWAVADLAGSPEGVGGSLGRQGETGPIGPPGPGLPPGGAKGKILAKLSGEDFDTGWTDAPSGVDVPGLDGQALVNAGGALGALTNVALDPASGFLSDRIGGTAVRSATPSGSLALRMNSWRAVLRTTTAETAFADVTGFANAGDVPMFASGAVGERTYWGFHTRAEAIGYGALVAGQGGAATIEIWTGSAWAAPSVAFNVFSEYSGAVRSYGGWNPTTVNGRNLYWIRFTTTSAWSTVPQGHFAVNSVVGLDPTSDPSNAAVLLHQAAEPLAGTIPYNGSLLHATLGYDYQGNLATVWQKGRGQVLAIALDGSIVSYNARHSINSVRSSTFGTGGQACFYAGLPDFDSGGGFPGDHPGTIFGGNLRPDFAGFFLRMQTGGVDRFTVKPGVLTMGRTGTDAGVIRSEIGQGGKYAGFRAAQSQIASSLIWTLPTTLGAAERTLATVDAAGTLGWRKAIPEGGDPYQTIAKNPDGTESLVWRTPDVRMLVVRAAEINFPTGSGTSSNPETLPIVLGITLPAGTLASDAMCMVTQFETRKQTTASIEMAFTFGGLAFANFPLDASGSGKTHTTDVEIMRLTSSTGRIVVRRVNQTNTIVHTVFALSGIDWGTEQRLVLRGNCNAAVGSEAKVLSVTSYIRNAGAASLLTVGA